ncbi:zinc finger BED domain-containing protein 5-like [Clavelina lepadiformis]|uniref:zinc finger BED domain-containing protein 5-like n=1 Tax=Clavelina lepadiformis TaxID=159417 RepID=UPI0040433F14
MTDIFQALNFVNLSFQGSNSNITLFITNLEAFIRTLDIWTKNVESKQHGMFKLLTTLPVDHSDKLSQDVADHFKLLRTELMHYFPDLVSCTYALNPFYIDPGLLPVGTGEQKEIIDIQADETAKVKQKECSSLDFWLTMASTYPTLARNAVPQLLVFPQHGSVSEALMAIKSKSRNCLTKPEHDFRCAVSNVLPRIDKLVQKKSCIYQIKLCFLAIHWCYGIVITVITNKYRNI